MFPQCTIHKFTWTSRGGKTHNNIDHFLIDRRLHSSTTEVRPFRGADCDAAQILMVAKVRERLVVSRRAKQMPDTERFNLKKLNEINGKEEYQVKIWKIYFMMWISIGPGKPLERIQKS